MMNTRIISIQVVETAKTVQ